MRAIRSFVDEGEALARLTPARHKRWLGRLWWLGRRPMASRRPLPFVERVWLPYHVIPIRLRTRKGVRDAYVSVEARSGAFAFFDLVPHIERRDDEANRLPGRLDAQEAIALARAYLTPTMLNRRNRRQATQLEGVEEDRAEILYFPYWVYYYERRPGLLDIRVLDAVTGERAGAKTRMAILEAFVEVSEHPSSADNASPCASERAGSALTTDVMS